MCSQRWNRPAAARRMLSLDITGRALRYLMVPARLSALMALCRQDDLEIVAGVPEVPLLQQIKGLNEDLYDVGFAQSYEMGDGILAELTWSMPLRAAMPAPPLLTAYKRVPLDKCRAIR